MRRLIYAHQVAMLYMPDCAKVGGWRMVAKWYPRLFWAHLRSRDWDMQHLIDKYRP